MARKNKYDLLEKESKEIRRQVLSMIIKAHASHIASSYSIIELMVYLYEKVLRVNPKKPLDANRDRFILSKGWGISALYAILAHKKFFSNKLLNNYCKDGSKLIGIATRNGIPGIEATTGSMGHGLPIGVGMAKGLKIQKNKAQVYVLISDGECDEGSTWEGILLGAHHKLDNLTVIIDYNKWQSFGRTNDVLKLEPLKTAHGYKCCLRIEKHLATCQGQTGCKTCRCLLRNTGVDKSCRKLFLQRFIDTKSHVCGYGYNFGFFSHYICEGVYKCLLHSNPSFLAICISLSLGV